jgi:trehalose 6-phosphate phosphatase
MARPKLNHEPEASPFGDLLAPFIDRPGRSALIFDIDGTLAPIARRPEEAAVPASTRDLLRELEERYALVACISGRRAVEARLLVGIDSLTYVGNHGLELLAPRARAAAVDPAVEELSERVRSFATARYGEELRALGVRIEDKHAIWTFHWRGAPDEAAAKSALERVAAEAESEGLLPHWGRLVLEIRPPFAADKGTAVEAALAGREIDQALYAGDDTTDLDAFRKLRELEHAGHLRGLCVGVRSSEGPAAITAEADLVVDGPDGVVELLDALTAASI